MSNKKNFKTVNPAMQFINTQEAGSKQQEQEPQETQEAQDAPKPLLAHTTQGKKGQRLPRINMAFSTANLDYLQVISRIEGVSITEYVNRLIEADMEARKDIIDQVRNLLKEVGK